MKILSLRIKNLASLAGEHLIDFESQPLASAGLIAIVGKTGAGKSTILDAMCLALFNRVPRLKDSDGKLVDVDGSELLTNSPLTVLRRGTGHGFAELSFVAQDQKVYSARWEIKRARENPTAKLQSVQRTLKCLTDSNVIADKAKAVESNILRITQLSFEQFTRAVLLAQSDVTAFLKARDNERGELLEYLTNSSIFGKIGQLAYEKTKQIASQRKDLENVLGHIELLSDEDFAACTKQFTELTSACEQQDLKKQKLLKHQQWFEHKQKLVTDIQTRQHHLQLQKQKLDQLAPEKAQLKQLEIFASIRPSLIQQKSLHAELAQLQPLLQQAQQQFTLIQQQFTIEKSAFEKIDAAQQHQHQFEIQYQNQIEQVRARIADRRVLGEQHRKITEELQTLHAQHTPHVHAEQGIQAELKSLQFNIEQLQTQLTESAHFNALDDGLTAHLNPLQRFIEQYKQFEKKHGNVHQANQRVAQQQAQFERLIQQYGQDDALNSKVASLRGEREQYLNRLNQLDTIQNQYRHFRAIDLQYRQLATTQQTLQQQIDHSKTELESAEQTYQAQKIAREQLQQVLQQQRLLHTENIENLRAALVDGEACLVCGSTDHPYTYNQQTVSLELFKLQEQQEQQALDKEKSAFDAWQHQQKICTQQSASWDANTRQLETLTAQLQQMQTQLEQRLQALQIDYDFSQEHQALDHVIENNIAESTQALQQLEVALSTHEAAQKQRHELSQMIQQTTQQLSVVHQSEQNIQHMLKLLNNAQSQAWQLHPLTTAEQVHTVLQHRLSCLKQLDDLNTQHNQKSQQLDQCTQAIKFSLEKIQTAEAQIENLLNQGKQNSDLAMHLIFQMTAHHVDKPHEWLAKFDQDRQTLQTEFNQARQQFNQIRESFEATQSKLTQYQTQQTQLHNQLHHIDQNIQLWLIQHPEFDTALLQQYTAISHEQEQQLKQQVIDIERAYTDAQSAMQAIAEQLEQHLQHQPEIDCDTVTAQLSTLIEHLKQLQQQRDDIKLKLEVHQRNLAKQQQFADKIQKIQAEEHRWNKISSLMGDATGKKFRDYAQQYNLDILIEYANQQLCMLSQRYTLKRLDNSLSLAIVDHDMDGETRSVASLSGGESFLTALALSLAIANMASGSMKIESLFIDEGFGTLDASSLHMVMNALDQLQSQGRKVVLISHIQEMHERIPVQIQVNPLGAGASTIQIVG